MSTTDQSSAGRAFIADFLAAPAVIHASWAPDGSVVAVTSVRVPVDAETETVGVAFIATPLGQLGQEAGADRLMDGLAPGDRMAVFDPSGQRVALISSRSGTDEIWVVERSTGAATAVAGATDPAGPAVWSPDGTRLAVPCRRGATIDRTRPYRWMSAVVAADGVGPLDDPPMLGVFDLAGATARWFGDDGSGTGTSWRWSQPRWSPDGNRIAAVVGADPQGRRGGQYLRIVERRGPSFGRDVALPGGRGLVPAWLPDGRLLVLVAEPSHLPAGSPPQLWIVHPDDRLEQLQVVDRPLAPAELLGDVYADHPAELADSYDGVVQVIDDRTALVRTGWRGTHGVARLDLTDDGRAELVPLIGGQRCVSPVAWANGRLLVTMQSATEPVRLAIADLGEGGLLSEPVTLAAAEPASPTPIEPTPIVRRFVVSGDAGAPLDGWLLTPPTHPLGDPPPCVVMIHGGPHYTFGEAFSIDAHELCAAGFSVLYTNPRGSTGYGAEFAHAVHGDWAAGPSADVLAVVDHAVDAGWIDGCRLGVTGNSFGGYLTCWLAATTSRFRAAVAENPVTDLVSMYGTSDIGATFMPRQFGGTPNEVPERYRQQSPVTVADTCRTPTLFVVGELDRRCPPAQALAMHRALRVIGTPSEVLFLPESSHEGSTYGPIAGRIAHNVALVEWMACWLIG